MIFNLLYKELRLAAHPNLFIFALMGVLVLVPGYPYGIVFLFSGLGIYISFMYGRETQDIYYTTLLPVRKRETVKAKCWLIVLAQMGQIGISLPFAVLRNTLISQRNPVGIEPNVAFYGMGLLIFGVFNLIFLPTFFKTAYKAGKAFVLAMIPTTLIVITVEILVHFPAFHWVDSIAAADLIRQLPILAIGGIFYSFATVAAYRISVKRFEKVDL
ncbi:ABC transporter [Enterococcus florum]|uniref:ABC transporter n=1 Tax=Enterococcus florum TaxID=2480627 RepID=A0A4P5PB72_9ENTE|nr:ABC-2 transporter permease [Enterococcus florum]GCF94946.1 ABC transporter [Enterococcus florum]